jgi:hypothetical protein
MESIRSGDIPGNSQWSRGTNSEEECSYDFVSPDAEKINTIHSPTGNQYFMNPLNLGTPDESGI